MAAVVHPWDVRERIEDSLLLSLSQAFAGISDDQNESVKLAVIIDLNFNNPSNIRVLNRVLNQVNCHLLKSLEVTKQIFRHKSELGRVTENVPFE